MVNLLNFPHIFEECFRKVYYFPHKCEENFSFVGWFVVVAGWVPDGVCALAVWDVALAVGYAVGCRVWYWVGCLVLGMVLGACVGTA